MILVHSVVMMAKLEILVAVAVFLETVSGTTVSATQNYLYPCIETITLQLSFQYVYVFFTHRLPVDKLLILIKKV